MAAVLITTRLFDEAIDRLRTQGHDVHAWSEAGAMPRDELLRRIGDADALIALLPDRIDAKLIARGTRLKIVANVAVGYENIDVASALAAGIVVTNTPDVLTEATADLTFALLLAAARRIVEGDTLTRRGAFPPWELIQPHLGMEIHGKALGIVGMGRIGTAVARRGALGFDMDVLYHNPERNPDAERSLRAQYVDFRTLLAESDFVCVHTPLTPETRHLFDRDAFRRMKPSALLVNVARGPVVDEDALVRALETGEIAGAALDVYENEPAVHRGLIALRKHVVLTPHIGSATVETRRAMASLAVDNVLRVLDGEPPLTPVEP